MRHHAYRLILSALLLALATCGQPTVEQQPDVTAGVDTGGRGNQGDCITDFDCKNAKGKTACGLPRCVDGGCQWVLKKAGAACLDPELEVSACEVGQCDEAGQCQLVTPEPGTPCELAKRYGECEQAACDANKQCKVIAKTDETPCGLGVCGNYCVSGACVPAPDSVYDDDNPCTTDYCDQNTTIAHVPVAGLVSCDDGDPCTGDGQCVDGACKKTEPGDCNDGLPCTKDTCGAEGCQHAPDDALCYDSEVCFEEKCDPKAGCVKGAVLKDTSCDDGDECTKGDQCDTSGVCTGGEGVCKCASDADCPADNKCLPRQCNVVKGLCEVNEALKVTCDTSGDGVCGATKCDPKTGACAKTATNEGGACDDNDVCTTASTCVKGACAGASSKACDDGNPCTDDACDPIKGCVATPNSSSCDDGSSCTSDDFCSNGACTGTAKVCQDGIPCTFDSCEPSTGECEFTAKLETCDDNNPCTQETCDKAKGCTLTPDNTAKCDDGNVCTTTACKEGKCVTTAFDKTQPGCGCVQDGDCDDNNECTVDSCDNGECKFDASAKTDAPCTAASLCLENAKCVDGGCSGGTPKVCDDDNPCTVDTCNSKTGACATSPAKDGTSCDDGDACTEGDLCNGGGCQAGKVKDCSAEGGPCAQPTCDAKTGACGSKALEKGQPCNDGKYCTDNDTCDGAGKCVAGAPLNCSALNGPCHSGVCDEASAACVKKAKAKGTVCNDGKFCTVETVCDDAGTCAGKPRVCKASSNPCVNQVCDESAAACVGKSVADGTSCDADGDACTKDACKAGKCLIGTTVCECKSNADCDDDNPCTVDTCSAKGTCTYGFNTVACDDGNPCTLLDTCGSGKCTGKPKLCTDGTICTADSCSSKTGLCTYLAANNDKPCEGGVNSYCDTKKCQCRKFSVFDSLSSGAQTHLGVVATSSGGVMVVGMNQTTTQGTNGLLSLYGKNGKQAWTKSLGGAYNDVLRDAVRITTKLGTEYRVVGEQTHATSTAKYHVGWYVTVNDDGKIGYNKKIFRKASSALSARFWYAATDGSKLYAGGVANTSAGAPLHNGFVVALDAAGNTLWERDLTYNSATYFIRGVSYYGGSVYVSRGGKGVGQFVAVSALTAKLSASTGAIQSVNSYFPKIGGNFSTSGQVLHSRVVYPYLYTVGTIGSGDAMRSYMVRMPMSGTSIGSPQPGKVFETIKGLTLLRVAESGGKVFVFGSYVSNGKTSGVMAQVSSTLTLGKLITLPTTYATCAETNGSSLFAVGGYLLGQSKGQLIQVDYSGSTACGAKSAD